MSIPVLDELQKEIKRLCAAGSTLAYGDFGLKKLLPPLKKMGETVPVFSKLAVKVEELTEINENSEEKLLDLLSLVNAIQYTQGTWEAKGEISELETYEIDGGTKISCRKLLPLIEALTTRNSGRQRVIEEAEKEGLFCTGDLRLVFAINTALEDPYPMIPEFIVDKVVHQCGTQLLPVLKDHLNLDGGRGDARRLRAICKLCAGREMDLYIKAKDTGSIEVKLAAIEVLNIVQAPDKIFEDLTKDKRKEIREAAAAVLEGRKTGMFGRLLSILRH